MIKNLHKHLINTAIAPFCDKFSLILVSLQLFSLIVGNGSLSESFVTICFLYLNAAIEMIQNIRNEREVDTFNEFFKIKAKIWTEKGLVLREIVQIGDIVHLNIGDRIPGDGIILDQTKFTSTDVLKVDESLLTGESESVIKRKSKITWEDALSFKENYLNRIIMKNTIYDKIMTNTPICEEKAIQDISSNSIKNRFLDDHMVKSTLQYTDEINSSRFDSQKEIVDINDGGFEGEPFVDEIKDLSSVSTRYSEEYDHEHINKRGNTQQYKLEGTSFGIRNSSSHVERGNRSTKGSKPRKKSYSSEIDDLKEEIIDDGIEEDYLLRNSFIISKLSNISGNMLLKTQLLDLSSNEKNLGGQISHEQIKNISEDGLSEAMKSLATIVQKVNDEIKIKEHMLTAGSYVTQGAGLVFITDKGKFINEIKTNLEEIVSDLTSKVEEIQKILFLGILLACCFLFIFCMMKNKNTLEIVVSLAVTAIPEGLELVVRINLSVIIFRLKRQKIFIKSLHALEKLGTVDMIVLDKTGTLTTNKQTVNYVLVQKTQSHAVRSIHISSEPENMDYFSSECKLRPEQGVSVSDNSIDHQRDNYSKKNRQKGRLSEFIKIDIHENDLVSAICNHLNDIVTIDNKEIGDPIDISMKRKAKSENSELIQFVPFCGEKMLTHGIINLNGQMLEVIKGAPEQILARCNKFEDHSFLLDDEKEKIIKNLKLRSVALGYKKMDRPSKLRPMSMSIEQDNRDFTFLAFITFENNLRPGTKECLEICLKNQIKICVLTGDAETTTRELLEKISISANFFSASQYINSNAQPNYKNSINVIYRASPYQKLEIIKKFQEYNKVLMAGDGINDLLAIKQADIGVSLGDGSDLSKEISQIVLTDSNISNILLLIQSGKLAYHNITAVLKYLISSNIGEVISVTLALLTQRNILTSQQLLFINILTDGFPATFLCMNRKYENGPHIVLRSVLIAIYIGLVTYFIDDITKSFIFIMAAEMLNSLTNISLGKCLLFSYRDNLHLIYIVCTILMFLPMITYLDLTKNIFAIQEIGFVDYIMIIFKASGVILIDEILKVFG